MRRAEGCAGQKKAFETARAPKEGSKMLETAADIRLAINKQHRNFMGLIGSLEQGVQQLNALFLQNHLLRR